MSRKENILKSAAKHKAYKVAAASKGTEKASDSSTFAQVSKAMIKMQMKALESQLRVLEELETMSDEEKLEVLFFILDKDRSGSLSAVELADGLRRVRGNVDFEESIVVAIERVTKFDKDGDGKLQLAEFKDYVDTLCEALGATFHEMSEMLIISVLFSDSGNTEQENVAAEILQDDLTAAIQEEEKLRKVMADERMKALFHLFDLDASGSVCFQEVVMGLYKITEDLEEARITAVGALMMFDEDGNQNLDYAEFTKFILKLINAAGLTFDEAIFNMTVAAAGSGDDLVGM